MLTAAARLARQEQQARAKQRRAWDAFVAAATKGRGISVAAIDAADAELFPE